MGKGFVLGFGWVRRLCDLGLVLLVLSIRRLVTASTTACTECRDHLEVLERKPNKLELAKKNQFHSPSMCK